MAEPRIKISKNGPYLVSGGVKLTQTIMESVDGHREYKLGAPLPQADTYTLCRCGCSDTLPFCDGHHKTVGFDGTEVASTAPYYERAQTFEGPTLDLLDDNRCAFARFCHREDGDAWALTKESGDANLRSEAIRAAVDCPAGRLVQHDKLADNAPIEPEFAQQEITLLEDPDKNCSAPLFVKGKIPLQSAEGIFYEEANRYTLCRCGGSANKPFCDAAHVNLGFNDDIR